MASHMRHVCVVWDKNKKQNFVGVQLQKVYLGHLAL